MNFTAASQGAFIKDHLGPRLKAGGHDDKKLLIFDQNRDGVEEWADVIYPDPAVAPYVSGMAVHWYASTFKVFEDSFDRIHAQYPGFETIHTEGCIDDLGKPAPDGPQDCLQVARVVRRTHLPKPGLRVGLDVVQAAVDVNDVGLRGSDPFGQVLTAVAAGAAVARVVHDLGAVGHGLGHERRVGDRDRVANNKDLWLAHSTAPVSPATRSP